jgi:hypothetical protein
MMGKYSKLVASARMRLRPIAFPKGSVNLEIADTPGAWLEITAAELIDSSCRRIICE